MYVHSKAVKITRSAFHDTARIGLPEYKIVEILKESTPKLESKRKNKYLVEWGRGKKLIRIRYAEYEDEIVVITVNMAARL